MFKQQIMRYRDGEEGFTLIELLVVIAILAILAGVVVFAVSGITDKGNTSACKVDTRTIRTAEEANFANKSAYADGPTLHANGFLSDDPTLHNVVPAAAPKNYTITITAEGAKQKCGVQGDEPGTTNANGTVNY